MATEQLGDLEIVEETPPTTPTEQEPKKKKPGPHNPDQAAEFVVETTQSVDRFMNKMHNYEPYAIEEDYQVLIAEYHHALYGIKDYFKQADRKLILKLVDDTSCKLLRMMTAKDAEDREKCPDPRVSTENLMTGPRALNRLSKTSKVQTGKRYVNFLTHSRQPMLPLQMKPAPLLPWVEDYIHTNSSFCSNTPCAPSSSYKYQPTSATLVSLGSKSNICQMMNFMNSAVSTPYCQGPTIQTWTAFHQNTQPEHWLQLFIITSRKECAQNLMPHRLKLPIYFKLREKGFLHPSQDANTTLVGNQPNQKKLKTSPTKKDMSAEKHTEEPQPSQPTTTEVDPKMPPLEDIRPKKKFRLKDPDSKHFPQ